MRIKLKYPDVETFIQKYAVNISRGGIFIATKTPKPVGTPLRFEFLLAASETQTTSIIRGEGQVQWTREFDPQQPTKAHGMGVRFLKLDEESQAVVDRALAWRAAQSTPRSAPDSPTPAPSVPSDVPSRPVSITPPPVEAEPTTNVGPPSGMIADRPRSPHDEVTAVHAVSPPQAWHESPPTSGGRTPEEPRGRVEPTRPIVIADALPSAEDSQPVTLPVGRPKDVETKPISLTPERRRPGENGAHHTGDDLDALAAEWGLSAERLSRVLRRRRPRMVEATAELERLLRKPPRPPAPSKSEARSLLHDLLERKPARADAQPAGGDLDAPANGKRKR